MWDTVLFVHLFVHGESVENGGKCVKGSAVPHQKCSRKKSVPQIENGTPSGIHCYITKNGAKVLDKEFPKDSEAA
jgi:hypothetical protein